MPSLPVLDYCPLGMASQTALQKLGLRPGPQVATWRYYQHRGRNSGWQRVPLYRISEAAPPTPEQLEAERSTRREVSRARREAQRAREQACLTARQDAFMAAITRFREWERADALVLDTETTDLHGQVIEVGVCRVDGDVLMDTLIRNTVPVEPEARAVHGITEAELERAPSFRWIAPHLREVLYEETVCTYNAPFDREALRRTQVAQGFPKTILRRSQSACVMEAYATLHGDYDPEHESYRWVSLERACAEMGVERHGLAHRALGDALTTAALIRAVAARVWPLPTEAPPGLRRAFEL